MAKSGGFLGFLKLHICYTRRFGGVFVKSYTELTRREDWMGGDWWDFVASQVKLHGRSRDVQIVRGKQMSILIQRLVKPTTLVLMLTGVQSFIPV